MNKYRAILIVCVYIIANNSIYGQAKYSLFANEVKQDYPSVVYDFLERYLYEIDSLVSRGEAIEQRLKDDKVFFIEGLPSVVATLSPQTSFKMIGTDDKYYQVVWTDSLDSTILNIVFPMQYELLLGKSKVQIEQEMNEYLKEFMDYRPISIGMEELEKSLDTIWTPSYTDYYYVESLNTSCYYKRIDSTTFVPIFDSSDLWHSAANLFQGVIDSIAGYKLYVNQLLYNYKNAQYLVSLSQWLAYCQSMKLNVYFAVEEEHKDGFKALLIAHSRDLNFNHVLSIIIPNDFVSNPNTVLKVTMNAYIPTQNIQEFYQQYVSKPKKRI